MLGPSSLFAQTRNSYVDIGLRPVIVIELVNDFAVRTENGNKEGKRTEKSENNF